VALSCRWLPRVRSFPTHDNAKAAGVHDDLIVANIVHINQLLNRSSVPILVCLVKCDVTAKGIREIGKQIIEVHGFFFAVNRSG
jgi:hypothetical protein